MPELPEVESLRRDLSNTLIGRTITAVEARLPRLWVVGWDTEPPETSAEHGDEAHGGSLGDGAQGTSGGAVPGMNESPPALGPGKTRGTFRAALFPPEALHGRSVRDLRRRAKLLVWDLDEDLSLVTHLKLAGQVVHRDRDGTELAHGGHPVPKWGAPLPHKASHVIFHLDDESVIYLTDIRQFARLRVMPTDQVEPFLLTQDLGPEPLGDLFDAAEFGERLARRRIPIKSVLLDQGVVGGIGNIYADESLWDARIHPQRPASSLTAGEVTRLHASIRKVLDYAVREGVAFVPQGKAVSDRAFPYCHGRAGTPCPTCGTSIRKEWVGGRGTHWCPECQT